MWGNGQLRYCRTGHPNYKYVMLSINNVGGNIYHAVRTSTEKKVYIIWTSFPLLSKYLLSSNGDMKLLILRERKYDLLRKLLGLNKDIFYYKALYSIIHAQLLPPKIFMYT